MAWVTSLPDVVDALVTAATTALPDWQVIDGPGPDTPGRDVLCIGVGNMEDADPYRATRDLPALGGRERERITVRCQASTWSGQADFATLRDRLKDVIVALDATFQGDPDLSDSCASVRIGSSRWYHLLGEGGEAGAGIHFDVIAVAFL